MAARKPVPEPPEAPAFTTDRMRLLAPLITPRVLELARQRIAEPENLFRGNKLRVDDDKSAVRIALILAHEMNPNEDFSVEEEGLIRGIDADTLRKRKKEIGYRSL